MKQKEQLEELIEKLNTIKVKCRNCNTFNHILVISDNKDISMIGNRLCRKCNELLVWRFTAKLECEPKEEKE